MDNDQLSQSDPPTVEDLSSFRNGFDGRDTDVFIAVMGMTGAGKSTLISKLTTGEAKPKIGDSLRSCTTEVDVFRFEYSPTVNVYLIDTPGFDDTDISDRDILRTLAARLAAMYSRDIPLHGILYLHRISDTRMGGSGMKNLRVFKKLCGTDALKKVLLVTTMWENVSEDIGAAREEELRTTKEFWGSMIQKGSRMERCWNNPETALRLVKILIQASESADVVQTPLQIQMEMVNGETELNGTEAAKEILAPLKRRTSKNTRELEEVRREAQEDPGDEEDQTQQQETIEELETKIQQDRLLHQRLESGFATTLNKLLLDKDAQITVEGEDHKQARLEKQYMSRDSVVSLISRPELFLDRRQSWSKSYPQRADISDPWYSRGTKVFSLSLKGRHCSFLGPAHSKSFLPQSTRNNLVTLERSSDVKIKRVILGEESSYFDFVPGPTPLQRLANTAVIIDWGAVQRMYPELYDFLGTNKNTACPTAVSLGPAGSYFINVDGRISFKCHPQSQIFAQAEDASRLWWGANGAYVLEFNGYAKQVIWDLKGQYGALEAILESRKEEIKELALNIEDESSFALILNDGSVYHGGVDDIVSSSFREYAERHFSKVRR